MVVEDGYEKNYLDENKFYTGVTENFAVKKPIEQKKERKIVVTDKKREEIEKLLDID